MKKSPLRKDNSAQASDRFLNLATLRDLAALLEVRYPILIWYASKSDDPAQYHTFDIPKKKGGLRRIAAPVTPLKIIQGKLSWILQATYHPRGSVHGFVRKRNIVDNAAKHRNKRYVFNLDLEDFSLQSILEGSGVSSWPLPFPSAQTSQPH